MPIKGLTDRGLAFPEIGQIRKGAPKDEKGYVGKDLSYFRVEFDEKESESQQIFTSVYGDQPKEINILLPFNEIERMWDAYLEAYTAGRMVARADGEKFIYLIDTKTGEVIVKDGKPYREYKEDEPVGSYQTDKGKVIPIYCKAVGRLKVVVPELKRFAYMTVMTTSVHDIANVSAQLSAIYERATLGGIKLSGIPLVIRRVPREISVPKADGTRVRMTKYVLQVEASPRWVASSIAAAERLAIAEPAEIIDVQVKTIPATVEAGKDVHISNGDDDEFEPPSKTEADQPLGQLTFVKDDKRSWAVPILDAIVNSGEAKARAHAANILSYSNLDPQTVTPEKAVKWVKAYNTFRMDMTIEQAAAKTNAAVN